MTKRDAWVPIIQIVFTAGICSVWILAVVSAATIGGDQTLPATMIILAIMIIAAALYKSNNFPSPRNHDDSADEISTS